jgi:Na+/melibiose symporter-like transporter
VPIFNSERILSDESFTGFAALIAVIYVIVMIMCSKLSIDNKRVQEVVFSRSSFSKALTQLVGNKRLLVVLAICSITSFSVTVFSKMTIFYAKTWLYDISLVSALLLSLAFGQILAIFIVLRIHNAFEKKWISMFSYSLLITSLLTFLLLRPSDLNITYTDYLFK